MSTAAAYVPRAGSFAEKAIEYLRLHGGEATTAVLAEHGDISPSFVPGMLAWPVKQGVLRVEKRGGLNHWSLGDGKPLPKPVDDDDETDTPREGLQHVVKAEPGRATPADATDRTPTHATPAKAGTRVEPPSPATVEREGGEATKVVELTEQLPTRPPRVFGCGIFSDGRLVLELASGDNVVLQRDETRALMHFLDRALHEELTA